MNLLSTAYLLPFTVAEITFKHSFNFEERLKEATRLLEKYPTRIPIIVEKHKEDITIPNIPKKKYLIPKDFTMAQLMYIIRRKIKLPSEKALFFFIGNNIPSSSELLGTIYSEHLDCDKFLYIKISGENTFG
jgi:GABA(A) receptor-associated protein